jgi:hypothetical protein
MGSCVIERETEVRAAALQVRVLRSLSEVEEIRSTWAAWSWHPDSDIDLYLLLMTLRPEIVCPYIIVVYRHGRPETMLVGRIVRQRIAFRVGYKTIMKPSVRLLSIIPGGTLGNLCAESSDLLVGEILRCLRHHEADVAELGFIPADSALYHSATKIPGMLQRDFFPLVQSHWVMSLSDGDPGGSQPLSKDDREQRRKAKKFLADHLNQIEIRRFGEAATLERMIADVEEIAKKTYQRGLSAGFIPNDVTRRLLQLEAAKGWLRTYILYVADKPCAFWLGNVYHGVFCGGAMGYDPAYGKYAVGKFLMNHGIAEFRTEGIKEIDFWLGDAEYKQRLSNRTWKEAVVYVFAPTFKGIVLNALRTPTVLIDRLARSFIEKIGILPTVKRVLRNG